MRVRDAVEDDRQDLGELADAPAEVMANVVHDRTVRVAESEVEEDGDADPDEPAEKSDEDNEQSNEADEKPEIVGFVGFDAMPGTVRVTYLRGTRAARERLLEEPVRFARKEGMAVEALIPEDESGTREVVEDAGFDRIGTGPRFDGSRTIEYHLDSA